MMQDDDGVQLQGLTPPFPPSFPPVKNVILGLARFPTVINRFGPVFRIPRSLPTSFFFLPSLPTISFPLFPSLPRNSFIVLEASSPRVEKIFMQVF